MRYQEEFGRPIANHGITLVPGDCVYVDLNADGEINSNDATRDIGYTDMPEYTAGLNTGFSWKNFDFSMQWTGAWNVDRMLDEFRRPLGDTNEKDCCFISMIQRGVHRLIHSLLNSRVLLACMLPIIMQGLTCI